MGRNFIYSVGLISLLILGGCGKEETSASLPGVQTQAAQEINNPYPDQCPLVSGATKLVEFYNSPERNTSNATDTHHMRINSSSCTIKSVSWEAHYIRPENSTNQVQQSNISGDKKEASVIASIQYPPFHKVDDYLLTLTLTLENQSLNWISSQSQYPLDISVER